MERKAFHALLLSFALITGAVTITSDAHAQTNTERLITVVDNTNEANDILASILDAVTSGFANVLEMLGVIDDDLQTIHTDLEAVHDDLGTVHADLETVHADLETVHADLETVHNDIESVNSAVATISGALGGSTTAFTQVNEQLTSISNMIDMIEVEAPADHSEDIATILADLEALKAELLPEEEVPEMTMEDLEEVMAMANMTTVLEQVRAAATTTDAASGGDLAAIIDRVVMVAAEEAQKQADASVEDAIADLRAAQKNATDAKAEADKAKDEADERKRVADSQIASVTHDKLFPKTTKFEITVANLAELDGAPASNEYSSTHTLDCTQDVYLISADVEPASANSAFSADGAANVEPVGPATTSVTVDGAVIYHNNYPPGEDEGTDVVLNLEYSYNYANLQQTSTKTIVTETNAHDVDLGTVTTVKGNAFSLDDYANRGTTAAVGDISMNKTSGDKVLFTGEVKWLSAFGEAECKITPQRTTSDAPTVSADDPVLQVTIDRPALSGQQTFGTGVAPLVTCTEAVTIKQVIVEGIRTQPNFFALTLDPSGATGPNRVIGVDDGSGYSDTILDSNGSTTTRADDRINVAASGTINMTAYLADERVLVTLVYAGTADTCATP